MQRRSALLRDSIVNHVLRRPIPPRRSTSRSGSTTLLGFSYSNAPSGAIPRGDRHPRAPRSRRPTTPTTRKAACDVGDPRDRASTLNYGFDAPRGTLRRFRPVPAGTYDHAGRADVVGALGHDDELHRQTRMVSALSAKQGSTTIAAGDLERRRRAHAYSNGAADMTSATYDGNGLRNGDLDS